MNNNTQNEKSLIDTLEIEDDVFEKNATQIQFYLRRLFWYTNLNGENIETNIEKNKRFLPELRLCYLDNNKTYHDCETGELVDEKKTTTYTCRLARYDQEIGYTEYCPNKHGFVFKVPAFSIPYNNNFDAKLFDDQQVFASNLLNLILDEKNKYNSELDQLISDARQQLSLSQSKRMDLGIGKHSDFYDVLGVPYVSFNDEDFYVSLAQVKEINKFATKYLINNCIKIRKSIKEKEKSKGLEELERKL